MTQPEYQLGASGSVLLQIARPIRLTIWLSVAIAHNRAVGLINDCHMNRAAGGFCFRRSIEGGCADETVAARHPFGWLPLTKHDGVKCGAIQSLQTDRRATRLIQSVQLNPGLECFFRNVHRDRRRGHKRLFAVHEQNAVLQLCRTTR